eukprot:Seg1918.2 transcript_id=Seg1918.2/GoldUCD/mRNA.D3Y31 product="hypothetical protein" protein_id=Seg1918.2/GoldUCD/D3Y31
MRNKKSVQEFYEALLIIGGPRLATFVAQNLGGPGIHTIYTWRHKRQLDLQPFPCEENLIQICQIYRGLMEKLSIKRVPVLTAEDETSIKAVVEYNQKTDQLVGFCGVKSENPKDHHCLQESATIVLGDDQDSYDHLRNAFQNYKIGGYARIILLNPLHVSLAGIVVLFASTCNKFSHQDVRRQWQLIHEQYNKYLEEALGPLIGHSSDGDSRRRKLMLEDFKCNEGGRYQPIQKKYGFIFSVRKEVSPVEQSGYVLRGLPDQDAIHQHKKLINPLDHPTRIMMMGPNYMVHMNHLLLVLQIFPWLRHRLTKSHLERTDRQNWQITQEISFKSVQSCLAELIDGNESRPPDDSLKGTYTCLRVVWSYVEIFFSLVATLSQRIKYAGYFVHFLAIWRNFIHLHPHYNLRTHFLTRECYQDSLIADSKIAHFAVILICYMRENFPHVNCRLDLSGSDPCETFFSLNVQWVGNHHNYSYGQMVNNINHMVRLLTIQADPEGPKFSRAHVKQENVWRRQYTNEEPEGGGGQFKAISSRRRGGEIVEGRHGNGKKLCEVCGDEANILWFYLW